MQATGSDLARTLKQTFGFDSFRPLQEEIIRDSLAGRDVFAVLPTGAGKSLCFQLPALLRSGLTLVVSPLIALMKDQVDGLHSDGIAATFVNSTLEPAEVRRRLQAVLAGSCRLLYVAPERVMQPAFLDFLGRLDLGLIAIDEAHCISEWGHDFRPDYRQLAELRRRFPETPLLAMTATATGRVREDILGHLKLRDPAVYIGSFNRPNLTYRVAGKDGPYGQLLSFVRARPGESGIVYCQARRTTESVAERLQGDGAKALPYHAGLMAEQRTTHQEAFLRDDVQVICATIAFGMGINKPNVRFIVHYDLPKSVEGYYQETGRAGRDGLPADCLLLFSAADVAKYHFFIDEKPDPAEREVARRQLNDMVAYAETNGCRRRHLLAYFGEDYPDENCGACDNCISPRATFDATAVARKFLGCLYRIREKSGFGVGIGHVADVLIGSHNEKVRRWGHDQLKAHGGGPELDRTGWTRLGRELARLGYLRQAGTALVRTLEMTQKGHELMTGRRRLELAEAPRGAASSKAGAAGQIECDDALFERLRLLRKRIADEHELRAFVVFSDVALRQMARSYPTSREAFMRISGVGESKLREWGEAFMREIRDYLKDNRKRTFEDRAAAARQPRLGDSPRETLRRFRAGQTVEEIARERELAASTILGHLGAAAEFGEEIEIDRFLSPGQQSEIAAAFGKLGPDNLTGVRELLGERYEYGLLRLYRGCMLRDGSAGNGDEEPRPVTAREEAAVSPSAKDARKAESPGRSPESALAPA